MTWAKSVSKWIKKRLDNDRNVCGGLYINTGKSDPFHEACKAHDEAYLAKKFNREYIDNIFYTEVKKVIRESPWYKKPYLGLWGAGYMLAVKMFGKIVWGDK